MSDCDHADFEASVEVHRLGEDGAIRNYMAEIKIQCAKCGMPFHFRGAPTGLSFARPAVDVPATTLRAPIAPGERMLADVGRIAFDMPES